MGMSRKTWLAILVCLLTFHAPARAASDRPRFTWETSLPAATAKAKAGNKVLVAYFRGSDWCPWCQKLEKEVLHTQAFEEWASQNIVLLDVDMPTERTRQSPSIRGQNEGLKDRYNVARTPTFVFLSPAGDEIDRCGYDVAKLRPDEQTEEPTAWLAYLKKVISQRPDAPDLLVQPDLAEAVDYAKKKNRPLLMLLTRPDAPAAKIEQIERQILKDPRFIRLANRQFSFSRLAWPADDDRSKSAAAFAMFAKTYKLLPAPVQLAVCDIGRREAIARLTQLPGPRVEMVLSDLEKSLPTIDYTGGWLEDFNLAKTIAAQQDRTILLAFVEMKKGEVSEKAEAEIFGTDAFIAYAAKNLVLVKADFTPTKMATQPPAIREQNKNLADLHAVRGYPFMVILDPAGRAIGQAKYNRGGPQPFLAQLDALRRHDAGRRIAPNER